MKVKFQLKKMFSALGRAFEGLNMPWDEMRQGAEGLDST